MSKKTLDTLIEDIYKIFETEDYQVNETHLDLFVNNLKETIKNSIETAGKLKEPVLRMSNIGKPDRQLYFDLKESSSEDRKLSPELYIKFLLGDVYEHFLIFLIREAGHEVKHEQRELEVEGVPGHTDCVVDGVPSDIKSASSYAFEKFKTGSLLYKGQDPFGYVGQLSAYRHALEKAFPEDIKDKGAAFIAIDKQHAHITVLKLDHMDLINPEQRIKHLKHILSKNEPPKEKCYPDQEFGKAGNRELSPNCTYCAHKFKCWQDANDGQGLRVFDYSKKPKYLTHVVKLPKVEEITAVGKF